MKRESAKGIKAWSSIKRKNSCKRKAYLKIWLRILNDINDHLFIRSEDFKFSLMMSSSSIFFFFCLGGSSDVLSRLLCSLFSLVANRKQNLTIMHATIMTMLMQLYWRQLQQQGLQWTKDYWKLLLQWMLGTWVHCYWTFYRACMSIYHLRSCLLHHRSQNSWFCTYNQFSSRQKIACTRKSNDFESNMIRWNWLAHSRFRRHS